jgi:hypothetical protein
LAQVPHDTTAAGSKNLKPQRQLVRRQCFDVSNNSNTAILQHNAIVELEDIVNYISSRRDDWRAYQATNGIPFEADEPGVAA